MTLHVEDSGAGEGVILVHSSGFSGRQWKSLAAALVASGRRAIVPDLTGHGRSPAWPAPQPFSFRTDVAAVAELVRAAAPVRLVGHSYGGLVALHVARADPAAIRSLHVFDPVVFGVLDPVADADVRATLDALELSGDAESWLRAFVEFWGGPGAWDGLREPVRAEFRRIAWVVQEGVRSLMTDTTPLAAYAALRVPTQVLTGEHSPAPARRVDERLAAAIAGAHLDVVAGAGHLAPVTHAAIVDRLVLAAIERS